MLNTVKSASGGKRILITGAGGFVGPHLIRALELKDDAEIFATVYKSTSELSDLVKADHIISGDLQDADFTENLIKTVRPEIIYHLASLSVVHKITPQATKIMNANTTLQYNLLEAVRLHAPGARVIAICSGNAYGKVKESELPIKETTPFRPLNPYAVSKITQEMLALQYYLSYGLDIVILRPFNHIGIGQSTDFVIPALIKQFIEVEKGKATHVMVGNLDTIRDFTDVDDMVEGYILAAQLCEPGEAYNLGTGHGHTIKEIVTILQKLVDRPVEVKHDQNLVRESDVPALVADSTKFKTLTGWNPKITLEETLTGILNYWRNNS